jgi:peptidoglycan/xylan/chitin deacetylase (PgdA/CDA1 family)
VVNVEHWNIERPMPRSVLPPPHGVTVVPDIPNWSWHEYGLRIGFWRIKQLLDQHKIRATLALNASVCAEYPQIIAGAQASGWEFMGHGFTQIAAQSIENEIGMINETLSTIQSITGRAPRGWLGPGLQETWETPDLLSQCGVEYVCDFVADDQPFELSTFSSPLLALPYTLEINDSPLFMVQYHQAEEFFNRARDQFDRLYQEGAESARIMTIALHPHLMGVPHRIKYLEMVYEYINSHDKVLHWTGSEILDWYRSLSHRK